jgi:hypothetical protein
MPALPTAQALTSQLAAMYRQPSPMLPSRLTLRTGRPLAGTAVWNWTAGLVTTAVWIWAAAQSQMVVATAVWTRQRRWRRAWWLGHRRLRRTDAQVGVEAGGAGGGATTDAGSSINS